MFRSEIDFLVIFMQIPIIIEQVVDIILPLGCF